MKLQKRIKNINTILPYETNNNTIEIFAANFDKPKQISLTSSEIRLFKNY